jgi:hypothetical protein
MRKIIQIASEAAKYRNGEGTIYLIALCDDGTLWAMDRHADHRGKWTPLSDIPQDKEPQ